LPKDSEEKEIPKVTWSNPIDLHVAADNFVSIPNVADVKVHVKQVAMVTYITISPITKADVSAKEIRSRLKGRERTLVVESELRETADVKIAKELKQALETGFSAINEADKKKDKTTMSLKLSVGLFISQLSLVVQDEASSSYTKGEIVRLTIDDLFFASYPASDLIEETGHHRNCIVFSIGDVQLDNQIQSQGNYDFPVVLVRQDADKNPYNSDHLQVSDMNVLEKHAVLKSLSVVHIQIVLGNINGRSSVIESVECAIKPLSFYIDDTFIFRCIKEAEGFLQVPLSVHEPLPVDILKLPSTVKSISRTLSCPVTIGHLNIQPVAVMFSIHASMKVFIASDHTPLSFGKFEKTQVCTTGYQLIRVLVMHYASGALFRAG
jgi:vacuolar protein sorting-associated protein 13B